MIYIFDTSALNRLGDDSDRESVLKSIRASGASIQISELNRLEVLSTRDPSTRQSLEVLLGRLSDHDALLIHPLEILRRCARANLGSESPAFELSRHWSASSPENDDMDELRGWMEQMAKVFSKCFKSSSNEEVLRAVGYRPQSSDWWCAPVLRQALRNPRQCRDMAADLYSALVHRELDYSAAGSLFQSFPEWLIYVGSWFYEMHRRGIKPKAWELLTRAERSERTIGGLAGFWDHMFAVYLPHCDVLVTDDLGGNKKPGPHGGQYRALRVLRCLSPHGRRAVIRTYDQLRRSLGLDVLAAPEAA